MPIRAVVFDLFDTLVDLHVETTPRSELAGRTVPRSVVELHAHVHAVRGVEPGDFVDALREVDRGLRESHYAKDIEVPSSLRFATLLERLGVDAPGLCDRLVETHMRALRGQVRAVAHHPSVLAALSARVPLAVCSNFSHSPTARHVLDASQLEAHLDAVVISDAVGLRKPRPEIFRCAIDALGVAADEVLHVGDSLRADVAGAAALGARTAWITRRVADADAQLADYDGPPPDFRIADLEELLAIVPAPPARA